MKLKDKLCILGIAFFLALFVAYPTIAQQTACYGAQGGVKQTAASGCEYEFQSGSTLDIQTGATVSFGDMPEIGSNGLYPLGYATADKEMVCGTTAAFTATTVITPTGLSTVTYAIVSQITTPASTGELMTVSAPTTSTFVISSWEADYTEGTTGVTAHWCAVGDQ